MERIIQSKDNIIAGFNSSFERCVDKLNLYVNLINIEYNPNGIYFKFTIKNLSNGTMLWTDADNLHVTLHQYEHGMPNTMHLRDARRLRDIPITIIQNMFIFNDIEHFLTRYGYYYDDDDDIYIRLYILFNKCFPQAFKQFLDYVEVIGNTTAYRATSAHGRRASYFKNKYIKYKNKYLKLKKMLESNN